MNNKQAAMDRTGELSADECEAFPFTPHPQSPDGLLAHMLDASKDKTGGAALDGLDDAPAAWKIRYKNAIGIDQTAIYEHNAIADYRELDAAATVATLYTAEQLQAARAGAMAVVAWSEQHTMKAIRNAAAFGTVRLTSEHGPYGIDRPTFKCDRLAENIVAIRDSQWQTAIAARGQP